MITLVFVSALLISNAVGEIDIGQLKTEVERELPDLPYGVYVDCSQIGIPTNDGIVDGYQILMRIFDTSLANDSQSATDIIHALLGAGVKVAKKYPEEKFYIVAQIFENDANSPSFEDYTLVGTRYLLALRGLQEGEVDQEVDLIRQGG